MNSKKSLVEILNKLFSEYDIQELSDRLMEYDLDDIEDWDIIEEYLPEALSRVGSENKIDVSDASLKNVRINLMVDALANKVGLSELNLALQKKGLRELYSRNFHELVLHFCLSFNESVSDSNLKIGPREFLIIYDRCNEVRNADFSGQSGKKDSISSGSLTIRKLRGYLDTVSDPSANGGYKTRHLTHTISNSASNQLAECKTPEDVADALTELITKYREFLTPQAAKARYYFLKYLLYYLESEAQSLCNILAEFAEYDIGDYLMHCYAPNVEPAKGSLPSRFYCNLDGLDSDDDKENFYASLKSSDQTKEDPRSLWTRKLKTDAAHVLFRSTLFGGLPLSPENVSPLFMSKGKKCSDGTVKELSYFRTIGPHLFQPSKEEYVQQVRNLTAENFIDYSVSLDTLATSLFALPTAIDKSDISGDRGAPAGRDRRLEKALSCVISGEREISRPTLLFFLAVVKDYIESSGISIPPREELSLKRVNAVLKESGFGRIETRNIFDLMLQQAITGGMEAALSFDDYIGDSTYTLFRRTFSNDGLAKREDAFYTAVKKLTSGK